MLVVELAKDSGSHLFAAVQGWPHPVSRESLVLADLFDAIQLLTYVSVMKATQGKADTKPKPYPRPWDDAASNEPKRLAPEINDLIDAIGVAA
jgi:hypothetical protein